MYFNAFSTASSKPGAGSALGYAAQYVAVRHAVLFSDGFSSGRLPFCRAGGV